MVIVKSRSVTVKQLIGVIFACLISSAVFAQSEYGKLEKEVKQRLLFLNNFIYSEQYKKDPSFNVDEYCLATARKLVKLLRLEESRNLKTDDFQNLDLAVTSNDKRNVKIYEFGYDCGGTRGWITHPIIQWTGDNGALQAYNFSSKINCGFYKLHPITNNLYLLLANEKASGACGESIAYVIQLKGSYLVLDYPAFDGKQSNISFCNVDMEYSNESKILSATSQHGVTLYYSEDGIPIYSIKYKLSNGKFKELK